MRESISNNTVKRLIRAGTRLHQCGGRGGGNYHLVGKQENDVNRLEVIGVRRRTFYILSLPPATTWPAIVGVRNQGEKSKKIRIDLKES